MGRSGDQSAFGPSSASEVIARDQKLMGAGTRLHLPLLVSSPIASGKEYMTSNIACFTADISGCTDFRAFYPWFYLDQTPGPDPPEVDIANDGDVWTSIKLAGVFTQGSFDGQAQGVMSANMVGRWAEFPGFAPSASSSIKFRTINHVAIGGVRPVGFSRMSTLSEAAEWSAILDLSKLSGGSVSNTATGQYYGPCLLVAKGNDGRIVPLILGNSIDFGKDETMSLRDAVASTGFWQRGFSENSVGPRLPYINFSSPGSRLAQQASIAAGEFRRRDEILNSLETGVPFDVAVGGDENGANTSSVAWRQAIDDFIDFINDRYGMPFATRTMLPKVTYANNKPGTTLADQTAGMDARLATNTDLIANVGPAIMCFQIGEAYHDAGTPSKWKVPIFVTTFAADYGGSGALSLNHSPPLGTNLVFNDGTAQVVISTVTAVSGSGPYAVICNNPVPAQSSGATVKSSNTDGDGTHPSTAANIEYGTPVVAAGRINLFQFDAASTALFARFSSQPTWTHKKRIDSFIKALKAGANAWGPLDAIYGIAGHDAQGSQRNWKVDAFNLTVVGAPVFTAFQGYETDSVDDELDAGFNPSTAGGLFLQNSGALGIWNLRDAQFTNSMAGWFDGTKGSTINPRTSGDVATARINQTGATVGTVPNTDARGLYIASRNSGGSAGMTMRKNGSTLLLTSNVPSSTVANSTFRLGRLTSTAYAQAKFALALIGGALSAQQQAEIYAAASEYLGAVGAI